MKIKKMSLIHVTFIAFMLFGKIKEFNLVIETLINIRLLRRNITVA